MTQQQKETIDKEINRLSHNEDNFLTNNYGSLSWQQYGYKTEFSPYTTQETLNNFLEFVLNVLNNE